MKVRNGFVSIPLVLMLVLGVALVAGGVAYKTLVEKPSVPVISETSTLPNTTATSQATETTSNPTVEPATDFGTTVGSIAQTPAEPPATPTGVASIPKVPIVTDVTQRSPFRFVFAPDYLHPQSNDTWLLSIGPISKPLAQSICSILETTKCNWNNAAILPAPQNSREEEPAIPFSISNTTVVAPGYYTFTVGDESVRGEYHIYLAHRTSSGSHDQVYEAHLKSISGSGPFSIKWDTRFATYEGDEFILRTPLAGLYDVWVLNGTTGTFGKLPEPITIVRSQDSVVRPYAKGTPYYDDPYWDGRGILDNAGAGVDTITVAGKRSEYELYRGTDMPQKNQLNAVVLRQNISGAIIVTVNVELIKFDDITLSVPSLTPTITQ